jgi:hypothetical protein
MGWVADVSEKYAASILHTQIPKMEVEFFSEKSARAHLKKVPASKKWININYESPRKLKIV